MISQKISTQSDLSHTTQQIEYYNQRLTALRRTIVGSTDKKQKVEEDLKKLNERVKKLTELVKETADDYYENIALSNAYSILVPASSDVKTTVKNGISDALLPVIGLELVLLMSYLGYCFFKSIIEETKKKRLAAQSDANGGSVSGDDDADETSDSEEKDSKEEKDGKEEKKDAEKSDSKDKKKS